MLHAIFYFIAGLPIYFAAHAGLGRLAHRGSPSGNPRVPVGGDAPNVLSRASIPRRAGYACGRLFRRPNPSVPRNVGMTNLAPLKGGDRRNGEVWVNGKGWMTRDDHARDLYLAGSLTTMEFLDRVDPICALDPPDPSVNHAEAPRRPARALSEVVTYSTPRDSALGRMLAVRDERKALAVPLGDLYNQQAIIAEMRQAAGLSPFGMPGMERISK